MQNIWGERILHFWAFFLPIGCGFVGITTFPFWFDKINVEIFGVFFLELMFGGQVSLDNLKNLNSNIDLSSCTLKPI